MDSCFPRTCGDWFERQHGLGEVRSSARPLPYPDDHKVCNNSWREIVTKLEPWSRSRFKEYWEEPDYGTNMHYIFISNSVKTELGLTTNSRFRTGYPKDHNNTPKYRDDLR